MRNWLVIFQPEMENTLNTMKVIDAWASNGSKRDQEKVMLSMENQQRYQAYGEGTVMLVETGKRWWI